MPRTTIVILNWNGMGHLRMFLDGVVKHSANPDTEICLADNGSTDGSDSWAEENFSAIKIIRLNKNHGFAGGYNRALDQLDSDYYVLLNSDIEVTEGWLDPLISYMEENPDAAACQPKILSYHRREYFEYAGAAGGFIDKYGYPFCRGRILDRIEKDEGQYDDQCDIFWSSGACMIVRSDAWKKCGGFDEDFFAHMEEIDLCWRFSKAGFKVGFIPSSVVYHVGGGSLVYGSPFKMFLNFRNSLFMLYKNLPERHFSCIILIRKILDGIAAVIYLLTGRFSYFTAVWKAHMAYYKNRSTLQNKRQANKINDIGVASELILNKSLIFEFYLRGVRTYSSLKINK
jgi:GT2 family glycosyltransferase